MKLQTKYLVPFTLGLLLFTAISPQPLPVFSYAQPLLIGNTTFSLPSNVPSGTKVNITSSDSMVALTQAVKQAFESKFSGTEVNVQTDETNAALKAVLDGNVDVAAIGRPLTTAEKDQGLVQVPVRREKIAVLVAADNPFQGNLNNDQFAKIMRGEVTDWSEVGGSAGAIRVVNRPAVSDLRSALASYPVFNNADFSSGMQLSQDNTDAMIKELGKDGIGYAIASKVVNQPGVRILEMYKTLPTDPRYPFSQPLTYVYKGPDANPAVQAFLGYATAPEGQTTIAEAPLDESTSATAASSTSGTTTTDSTAPSNAGSTSASPSAASPGAAPESTATVTTGTTGGTSAPATGVASGTANSGTQGTSGTAFSFNPAGGVGESAPTANNPWGWLWWLLPLGLLGLLLGWLAKYRDRRVNTVGGAETNADWQAGGRDTYGRDPYGRDATVRPGTTSETVNRPGMTTGTVTGTRPGTPIGNDAGIDRGTGMKMGALGGALVGGSALAASAIAKSWRTSTLGVVPIDDVDSRLVLVPHHPEDAYVHWQLSESYKQNLRRPGSKLMVRLYDVTGIDTLNETPVRAWEYECDERATRREVMIPQRDRNYVAELGYLAADGTWTRLLRSPVTHVPTDWNPRTDPDSSVPRDQWNR